MLVLVIMLMVISMLRTNMVLFTIIDGIANTDGLFILTLILFTVLILLESMMIRLIVLT
jgi:hypothetical protein